MRVSFVSSARDNKPTRWEGSWDALASELRADRRRHPASKDGRAICPATFADGGLRNLASVVSLELLALDVDESDPDLEADWRRGPLAPLLAYRCAVYSSWSHFAAKDGAPPCPRFRVLLPLSRPIAAAEYAALFDWAGDVVSWAGVDKSCRDASRLFYTPRPRNPAAEEPPFWYENLDGAVLDPDDLGGTGLSVGHLIVAKNAEAEARRMAARPTAVRPDSDADGRWFAAALRGCCEAILGAVEGDRHRMIYTQSATMAEFDWLGRGAEARAALESAACAVLPEARHAEAVRTVGQAYAHGRENNPPRKRPERDQAPTARVVRGATTTVGTTTPTTPTAPTLAALSARLLTTKDGAARAVASNTTLILRHDPAWANVLAVDERREQIIVRRPPPYDDDVKGRTYTYPRTWCDADIPRAQVWFAARWGYVPASEHLAGAVLACGDEHGYDAVREYLDGLTWDGERRAETILSRYLGVGDTPLHRAMARAWLVSAVARAYVPGCKVDHMLVVQGPQGLGKSSFFSTLAGEPYFLDHLPPITDKDARTALRGPWIVEFAELAGMKHAEQEHTKAFLTTQRDRYRPSYGRYEIDSPRRCVFAGTTNEEQFLRDDTGARRFWCVTATKSVDLVALFGERDQIWAEAVAEYRDGVPWHLSGELELEAREAAAARYVEDPWLPIAAEWVAGRPSFAAADFAAAKLDMSPRDIHRGTENRLGAIFRELGFERRRIQHAGRREWRWVAKEEGHEND